MVMSHLQDQFIVYDNGVLQQQFDVTNILKRTSCTPTQLIQLDKDKADSTAEDSETLTITNSGNDDYKITVTQESDTNSIITKESTSGNGTLQANSTTTFQLIQNCSQDSASNPNTAWGFIYVNVTLQDKDSNTQNLPFQFAYTCNDQYNYVTFDWSLVILIGLSIFLMGFLTKFSRIMSFSYTSSKGRFQGMSIDGTVTLMYLIIYCIGFFFVFYSLNVQALGLTVKITTYVLGFTCSLFIIDEVIQISKQALCLSPDGSWWKRRIILNVRVCEILSFILAAAFMSLYLITSAWYISDLISIFIMATIAKLFKFKNLKYAYLYMLTCVLLDGTAAALVLFQTEQSYNSLTLKTLNCPLELQLPLIQLQFDRSCAWISLFSIAIPGQFIGFTYRYDKNKRTFSYTFFTILGLILGYCIWITTTVVQTKSFPSSVFIYPVILLSATLIALKRNEWQSIWDANFFDEFLEKTYRLSNLYGKDDVLAPKVNLLEGLDQCPDEPVNYSSSRGVSKIK